MPSLSTFGLTTLLLGGAFSKECVIKDVGRRLPWAPGWSFKLKDCTVLSLSDAGLGDSGVKVLATSLADAPSVLELSLINNGIGDEVRQWSRPLTATRRLTNLRRLTPCLRRTGLRRPRRRALLAWLGAGDALPRAQRDRRPWRHCPRRCARAKHRPGDAGATRQRADRRWPCGAAKGPLRRLRAVPARRGGRVPAPGQQRPSACQRAAAAAAAAATAWQAGGQSSGGGGAASSASPSPAAPDRPSGVPRDVRPRDLLGDAAHRTAL